MPVRIPDPENCSLCRGTETVQLRDDFTGRLYPCPECRQRVYTVTYDVPEDELRAMGVVGAEEEFTTGLKASLHERLMYELIDHVGEVTRERIYAEHVHRFTAKLTVIHPLRKREKP